MPQIGRWIITKNPDGFRVVVPEERVTKITANFSGSTIHIEGENPEPVIDPWYNLLSGPEDQLQSDPFEPSLVPENGFEPQAIQEEAFVEESQTEQLEPLPLS